MIDARAIWHSWIDCARTQLVIVWIGMTVLALAPVWLASVLPMLDVPNHLAQIRAWHSFSDPRYHIAAYFDLRIHLVPYMLYHSAVHALMFVFPILIANKIVISIYVVAFPASFLVLVRALHRDPWIALLSFAFVYNQCFLYGFVSFLLALPLLWLGLAALIRYLDNGRVADLFILGSCAIGALLGHILPWILLGVFAIALCALEIRRHRRIAAVAMTLLPSLVLAIYMFKHEQRSSTFVQPKVLIDGTWRPFTSLILEFPARILDLFPGALDMAVLAALTVVVTLLAIRRGTRPTDARQLARRRILVLLAVAAIAYRAFPFSLEHPVKWWFIAPRIPMLIATLLLLLPAPSSVSARPWAAVAPGIVAIGVLMLFLTHLYRDFSFRNRGFFALIGKTPYGASTMVAPSGLWHSPTPGEASGDPASSVPVYWHWTEWPMVLRGGYSPYIFDVGFPIVAKPGLSLIAPAFGDWDSFRPQKAPLFDYYLVQHPTGAMSGSPCCNVVDAHGSWVLFNRIK